LTQKIKIKLTRSENCIHYGVPAGSVVELDLENEYLPICVSSEIFEANTRTPMEAKKAQAIAARTYLAAHVLAGTVIDDTTKYQAFKWKNVASIPNCALACHETSGQVLAHDGKLITAWYSASNGGRTKRSDEVWSAHKPWTAARDDPWDARGREMWGEVKASHGVGMSQTGAAYAAFIGKACAEILAFYYPNTAIVGGYGNGDEAKMSEKTNIGLVEWARRWVGQAYWYGTYCIPCTASLLNSKTAQYPSHYADSRMARYRDDIAKGKSCADCVGLIKGYIWEKDGKVTYSNATDVGANGMYQKATIKGPIETLPEAPGVCVWKDGHIGVYEGRGSVIEAKGFAYGVIRSKLSDTKWTHWLVVPFISYAGYEDKLLPEPVAFPYTAKVITLSSPLNIWDSPSKGKSILQVPKGDTLTVLGHGGVPGWFVVEKNGKGGQADGQYLQRLEVVVSQPAAPETKPAELPRQGGKATYTAEEVDTILQLLARIEQILRSGVTP